MLLFLSNCCIPCFLLTSASCLLILSSAVPPGFVSPAGPHQCSQSPVTFFFLAQCNFHYECLISHSSSPSCVFLRSSMFLMLFLPHKTSNTSNNNFFFTILSLTLFTSMLTRWQASFSLSLLTQCCTSIRGIV